MHPNRQGCGGSFSWRCWRSRRPWRHRRRRRRRDRRRSRWPASACCATELRRSLVLLLGAQRGATLDTNAIEDAAVMLVAALGEEGFQKPAVTIKATLADGTLKQLVFDASLETALPRAMEARSVEFRVKPGVRWHIDVVEITGLTALPVKTARAFFRVGSMPFLRAKTNAYSPSRVESAAGALLGELRQRGYADAVVRAEAAKIDEKSGAVALRVEVTEGARWQVAVVALRGRGRPGGDVAGGDEMGGPRVVAGVTGESKGGDSAGLRTQGICRCRRADRGRAGGRAGRTKAGDGRRANPAGGTGENRAGAFRR